MACGDARFLQHRCLGDLLELVSLEEIDALGLLLEHLELDAMAGHLMFEVAGIAERSLGEFDEPPTVIELVDWI